MAAAPNYCLCDSVLKIIEGPDFRLKTKRCGNVRDTAMQFLKWIDQFPNETQMFEKQMMGKLKPILTINHFSKKDKLWIEFHSEDIKRVFGNVV